MSALKRDSLIYDDPRVEGIHGDAVARPVIEAGKNRRACAAHHHLVQEVNHIRGEDDVGFELCVAVNPQNIFPVGCAALVGQKRRVF